MIKRNLTLILGSRFVSLLGSGIQTVAIPLYVLDVTGSGYMLSLVSAVTLLPVLFFSMIAGFVGDRFNKKSILVLMDVLAAIALVAILGLESVGLLNILALLFLQATTGILDTFYNNASRSILPELFGTAQLGKYTAMREGMDNLASMIGPLAGASLYAIGGLRLVMWVNMISFFVSFAMEIFLKYEFRNIRKDKTHEKSHFIADYRAVLAVIHRNKALKQLLVLIAGVNVLAMPLETIAIPYLFIKTIQITKPQFGLLQAAMVGGLLLGNALFAWKLHNHAAIRKIFQSALILQYVLTLGLSALAIPVVFRLYADFTLPFIAVALVVLLVIGIFNAICNTLVVTSLQRLAPPEMMSRFMAVMQIIFQVVNPLGLIFIGALIDIVPVFYLMAGMGVVLLMMVLWFVRTASGEIFVVPETVREKSA